MFNGDRSNIQRLSPHEILPRHRHGYPYAALVLTGRYLEAGDLGRRWVEPGDVVVHGQFEAHADQVPEAGATILNLRLESFPAFTGFARIAEPDEIVRQSEFDPRTAAEMVVRLAKPVSSQLLDWPDALAHDLRRGDELSLEDWAAHHCLAPETVSRGFRRAFGVSPRRYRLDCRTQWALRGLMLANNSLATIAIDSGFSDQAHMTRAVRDLTGLTPRRWRGRSSPFKN
jgi:AraC-like DNA-binding protein